MTNNKTLTYRVGKLEENTKDMDKKLYDIITNDLPHIRQDLQSLKVRMNVLTAVNVGAIIFAIVVAKVL